MVTSVQRKKLKCPHTLCGRQLRISETRGEFRRRACTNGHLFFTEDDEFVSEAIWKFASNLVRSSRPKPNPTPRCKLHVVVETDASEEDGEDVEDVEEDHASTSDQSGAEAEPSPFPPLSKLGHHVFHSETGDRHAYVSVGSDLRDRVAKADLGPRLSDDARRAANPFGLSQTDIAATTDQDCK